MLVDPTTISNNIVVIKLKSTAEVSCLLKVVQRILQEANDHEVLCLSFSNYIHVELAHSLLDLDGKKLLGYLLELKKQEKRDRQILQHQLVRYQIRCFYSILLSHRFRNHPN